MDLKLNSQRNWIAKNPIRITRAISNCYENSRAVIESLFEDLQPALNAKMRPKIYGSTINYISYAARLVLMTSTAEPTTSSRPISRA